MTKITPETLRGAAYARLGIPAFQGHTRKHCFRRRAKVGPRAVPTALTSIAPGVCKRPALIGPMPAPVKVRARKARPGRLATIGEIIAAK